MFCTALGKLLVGFTELEEADATEATEMDDSAAATTAASTSPLKDATVSGDLDDGCVDTVECIIDTSFLRTEVSIAR